LKPISPLIITLWVIASAVIGFGYSQWAVNNGLEVPISAQTLALSIALIAIILLAMVTPIWKYKRNLSKTEAVKSIPVNPFYAVRVLLLAKASAITAAMFIGWHGGVLIKQLTAPVVVADAMSSNITVLIVSVLLLVEAFLIEQICKLPKDKNKDV
jgi:hypothetical protein